MRITTTTKRNENEPKYGGFFFKIALLLRISIVVDCSFQYFFCNVNVYTHNFMIVDVCC